MCVCACAEGGISRQVCGAGERREGEFQQRKVRNNSSETEGKPGDFSIKDASIKKCFQERVSLVSNAVGVM